jgi:hypothetical protein
MTRQTPSVFSLLLSKDRLLTLWQVAVTPPPPSSPQALHRELAAQHVAMLMTHPDAHYQQAYSLAMLTQAYDVMDRRLLPAVLVAGPCLSGRRTGTVHDALKRPGLTNPRFVWH